MYIASGFYPWTQLYKAASRLFDLTEVAGICSQSGYDGFEPMIDRAEDFELVRQAFGAVSLNVRTAYVNATLHDRSSAEAEIDRCRSIAKAGAEIGLELLVVNPVPLDWSSELNKSDEQLSVQLASVRQLGEVLQPLGVGLAYHTHDSEMRAAARELHHMLLNTTNDEMTWCLDADWIYRGSQMSRHVVYDLTRLYADRVSVVHVRQSIDEVWTDAASEGDLNYRKIADLIHDAGRSPLLVGEQIPNDPVAAFDSRAADARTTLESIRTWFS